MATGNGVVGPRQSHRSRFGVGEGKTGRWKTPTSIFLFTFTHHIQPDLFFTPFGVDRVCFDPRGSGWLDYNLLPGRLKADVG
jgi:hypothetical protein